MGHFVAFLPVVFLGALAVAQSLRVWRGRRTLTWPQTPGVITHSQVLTVPGLRGSLRAAADIRYQYVANGRTLTGETVGLREGLGTTSEDGPGLVRRYPKGASVTVWHDPRQPDRAVLQPGASSQDVFVLSILVMATIGLLIGLWYVVDAA